MHGHLVTVEVGVEGGADQWMKLDRLTFDQDRLEGLNTKAVKGRRPVQQHRMLADHFFQDVPDLGTLLLDHAFRRLDRRSHAIELELRVDERLEELQSHLFRQTALMQLELRSDDDHGTPGVVHAFAEEVLPEPPLLALEHVGQRLQGPFVGAGDDPAAPPVVE